MIDISDKQIQDGLKFVLDRNEPKNLDNSAYCSSRDIFIARLDKYRIILEKKLTNTDISSLLTAITGEIGNNSFDHNLGNWRDIPGVYFDYDLEKRIIVLADRGQGVRKTLQKVKPEINSDQESLQVAFTQTISGRAPERRGNGLKFVCKVAQENQWELMFYSGDAKAIIGSPDYKPVFDKNNQDILGTIAVISFRSYS